MRTKKKKTLIKLDLSFGELPKDFPFARVVKDPKKFPWPLADASVEEAYSAYLLGRVPGHLRGVFMDELWRVLIPGGKVTFIVPYWTSARAIQDPLSAWPPLSEQSFLYFNKGWREANKLDYDMECDYDFTYGYTLDQETSLKSFDTQPFWTKHYTNAVQDLQLVLTKRPCEKSAKPSR